MVLAAGLEKANIDIVGGDSVFFDKLIGSITMGKSVDGFVGNSDVAQGARRAVARRLGQLHRRPAKLLGSVNTADVSNLTLSAFLLQQIKAGGADAASCASCSRPRRSWASPTRRWPP